MESAAAATATPPGTRAPLHQPAPDATARRILEAGMRAFAREGYAGATTRMIAAAAGVTLPVIAYHYGNKEGLHRACAEAIVGSYREHMLPLVLGARRAADTQSLSSSAAAVLLGQLLDALVSAIAADPEQRLGTDFVLREMTEQGPGFSLLYQELWQPGILLVADLLAIARGHQSAGEQERTGALMLLASLTAFTTQAPISLPVMGWQDLGESHRSNIAALARQLLAGLIA
ncbi:TetR/AcrR family transcriptional regulator [Sandaracinobacteroides hominis]|uniref:TetR/AcrR family transcriptional regulator n=1 Tax=Sandaracinobacteroides hominis TaxID=2780086 RepID=UPI0018F53497|nr:helix-turn-helix domain-containing protein [Sandaracinobacteroides hominis]